MAFAGFSGRPFFAVFSLMTIAVMGAGCGGDLKQYTAETAWKKLEEQGLLAKIPGTEKFPIDLAGAKRKAEAASQNAQTPVVAINEIATEVATKLAIDLPAHHATVNNKYRSALASADLVNKSGDKRLDAALQSVTVKLGQNTAFTNRFTVISRTPEQAKKILDGLTGSSDLKDFIPADAISGGISTIAPEDIYVLTGTANAFTSPNKRELTTVTFIQVDHPLTRKVVVRQEFTRKYVFHPGFEDYISEEKDKTLKSE